MWRFSVSNRGTADYLPAHAVPANRSSGQLHVLTASPSKSVHLQIQVLLEEREQRLIVRGIREAHLPRMKMLNEFDFARNHKVICATDSRACRGRLYPCYFANAGLELLTHCPNTI